MAAPRAAIYTRISRDPVGDGGGVARQEVECRSFAARLDVDVVHVYSDNDASAFTGTRRSGFEQLLAAIRERDVDVVLAWHPDRLYRRTPDLIAFVDALESSGANVTTVLGGHIDLSTATGRMAIRVLAALAEHESERKSERLRSLHDERARQGRFPPGIRSYGYRHVGNGMLEIDATEAAVIRDAAARLLQGESAYAICKDFQHRGVTTGKGGAWYPDTLLDTLTKPSVYGYRRRGDAELPGAWEPILDRTTVERIRQLRAGWRRELPSRAYLLSGLMYCGRCGQRLHGCQPTDARRGPRSPVYRCEKQPGRLGCGSLSIVAMPAEAAVTAELLKRLGTRRTDADRHAGPSVAPVHGGTTVDELYSRGSITRMEWTAARAALRREHAERKVNATDNDRRAGTGGTTPHGGDWDALSFDEQAQVVRSHIQFITVRPATGHGGSRFDRSRIVDGIVWQDAP